MESHTFNKHDKSDSACLITLIIAITVYLNVTKASKMKYFYINKGLTSNKLETAK